MNKVKIFFAGACLVLAVGVASAQKVFTNTISHYEYYGFVTGLGNVCKEIPDTGCTQSGTTCVGPNNRSAYESGVAISGDYFTCLNRLEAKP
jgi:hypothetical protein